MHWLKRGYLLLVAVVFTSLAAVVYLHAAQPVQGQIDDAFVEDGLFPNPLAGIVDDVIDAISGLFLTNGQASVDFTSPFTVDGTPVLTNVPPQYVTNGQAGVDFTSPFTVDGQEPLTNALQFITNNQANVNFKSPFTVDGSPVLSTNDSPTMAVGTQWIFDLADILTDATSGTDVVNWQSLTNLIFGTVLDGLTVSNGLFTSGTITSSVAHLNGLNMSGDAVGTGTNAWYGFKEFVVDATTNLQLTLADSQKVFIYSGASNITFSLPTNITEATRGVDLTFVNLTTNLMIVDAFDTDHIDDSDNGFQIYSGVSLTNLWPWSSLRLKQVGSNFWHVIRARGDWTTTGTGISLVSEDLLPVSFGQLKEYLMNLDQDIVGSGTNAMYGFKEFVVDVTGDLELTLEDSQKAFIYDGSGMVTLSLPTNITAATRGIDYTFVNLTTNILVLQAFTTDYIDDSGLGSQIYSGVGNGLTNFWPRSSITLKQVDTNGWHALYARGDWTTTGTGTVDSPPPVLGVGGFDITAPDITNNVVAYGTTFTTRMYPVVTLGTGSMHLAAIEVTDFTQSNFTYRIRGGAGFVTNGGWQVIWNTSPPVGG